VGRVMNPDLTRDTGRTILLNPGPVTLSARVRTALLEPDLCHREEEYADLQDEVRRRLLEVYDLDPATWAAVLLGGSGTTAMEAMVSSLVPATGTLAVVENGVYGERLSRIATIHGLAGTSLTRPWGADVSLDAVTALLDHSPHPTHLAVVHHETTTGRLNPIDRIGAACRNRSVGVLLDGVSSFGAEPIDFEAWGITACAGTANKCLHGVPGVAFVIVRRDALLPPSVTPRTLSLDLGTWCRAQDTRGTPFTPPVTAMHACAEALREHAEEGGATARRARYETRARIVARGFEEMGMAPLLREEDSSVVLRSWQLPAGVSYAALHDGLKDRGFVIYAGQGVLARAVFRVAVMGDLGDGDLERFVRAVGEVVAAERALREPAPAPTSGARR